MEIVIYILTFFLVVDCLFLGLLILMQLPKKEAGLGGAAFGGGAVDALVGAGAGNVLTKATKWSAITFFALVITLSVLYSRSVGRESVIVSEELKQTAPSQTAPAITIPDTLTNAVAVPVPGTAAPESPSPAEEPAPTDSTDQ